MLLVLLLFIAASTWSARGAAKCCVWLVCRDLKTPHAHSGPAIPAIPRRFVFGGGPRCGVAAAAVSGARLRQGCARAFGGIGRRVAKLEPLLTLCRLARGGCSRAFEVVWGQGCWVGLPEATHTPHPQTPPSPALRTTHNPPVNPQTCKPPPSSLPPRLLFHHPNNPHPPSNSQPPLTPWPRSC